MRDEIAFDEKDTVKPQPPSVVVPRSRIAELSAEYSFPPGFELPVWVPEKDDDFEMNEFIMYYGSRREGKSTTAEDIALRLRRLFPIAFCFTSTDFNNFWRQVLPYDKVIHVRTGEKESRKEDLEDPMRQILECQSERITEFKQAVADGEGQGNPTALVIADDIIDNDTMRECHAMMTVAVNGRHYEIGSWVLTQTWVGLTPSQRKQLDRLVLFRPRDKGVADWVLENYGQNVLNLYRKTTKEKYTAFVIVNKANADGPKFFKYRTDIKELEKMRHRNLKLGNSQMWAGVDLAEQKKEHPYVPMPAKATLIANFNRPVGRKRAEEEDENNEELLAVAPTEAEPEDKAEAEAPEVFSNSCLLL